MSIAEMPVQPAGCIRGVGGQMIRSQVAMITLSMIAFANVQAETRLPVISPTQYTQEQKQAAADFVAARKVPVFGPFEPMMYSPQIMSTARAMGDYLRYKSALGNTLSELVILMTAREWRQEYELVLALSDCTEGRDSQGSCRRHRHGPAPDRDER